MLIMQNNEKRDKSTEALIQEIETLTSEELHELFMFYYKINHYHYNLISSDKFELFLRAFDKNPFRCNDDKTFRKQFTDALVEYTNDYMSLLTAVVLIKRKFTTAEIIENYYANVDFYNDTWY